MLLAVFERVLLLWTSKFLLTNSPIPPPLLSVNNPPPNLFICISSVHYISVFSVKRSMKLWLRAILLYLDVWMLRSTGLKQIRKLLWTRNCPARSPGLRCIRTSSKFNFIGTNSPNPRDNDWVIKVYCLISYGILLISMKEFNLLRLNNKFLKISWMALFYIFNSKIRRPS